MDLGRIQSNVERSDTEDLLDRATVYRTEMEPEALAIIEDELKKRGVTVPEIEAHLQIRRQALTRSDGSVIRCSYCYRPAVESGVRWFRLLAMVPLFKMGVAWCERHLPAREPPPTPEDEMESEPETY